MRKALLTTICIVFMTHGLGFAQDDERTPYEIAFERIEDVAKTGAESLVINLPGLETLPPEIGQLLTQLTFSQNELGERPPEIGQIDTFLFE